MPRRPARAAVAWAGGRLATGLVEVTDDLRALDGSGWWAVVVTFEGRVTCARFADVRAAPPPAAPWVGVGLERWRSSLDEQGYVAAVADVRRRVAAGDVYQVNVCRVLDAPLGDAADESDVVGLFAALADRHAAPYRTLVHLPDAGVHVASASPELFLQRRGARVRSGPIKGTGRTAADLTGKDRAENVMIVDLVRNDLGRVCRTGSVVVEDLLRLEQHPGLVHLTSYVAGDLRPDAGWPELLQATFPPGSVTGAPKSSALRAVADLEPVPRGAYCGAVGWVDADRGEGVLAVGIRTFELGGGALRFGTGAGITWSSDPRAEWAETELKAERLLHLAAVPSRASRPLWTARLPG